MSDISSKSILFCLVARTILDSSALQLRFHVFRYPTFDTYSVYPSYIFCYGERSKLVATKQRQNVNAHVRCHLATQLVSGSITAMMPS